uniref:Flocculation protein FLO11-like n=1 Tax=Nicotiana tabacum TaxID=4097 RepID=A0A1S3ZNJ5_TOBAC|nr:PREDICTED: flocculation protein FLO11-like [Nicotiana tabacum]
MPKSSQTPSKAKSSSKTEDKSKNMKPKSKKSVKASSEPAPTPAPSPSISSNVPIPSSIVPDALTIPTSTGPSLSKPTTHASVPTSKNTSKLTKIKATSRKSVKNVKVVPDATSQVDTMVKEAMVQGESMSITTSQKEVDTTIVVPVVEGEESKEPVQKEASDGLSFSWAEDDDDNGGEKEEGVVGSYEEHTTQDISNEEEKSENKGDFGKEKERKKSRKTHVKATKSAVPTRKEVAPPSRTTLTKSKRKVVDEQIIKEFRGGKKPRKQVSVVEHMVELDGEDESKAALPEKSSTQKRKVSKATKTATPSTRANRGKKRKNVPVVVDRLTEFRNRKVLMGRFLQTLMKKGWLN